MDDPFRYWKQGFRAYCENPRRKKNPYRGKKPSEEEAKEGWERGWKDAEEIALEELAALEVVSQNIQTVVRENITTELVPKLKASKIGRK